MLLFVRDLQPGEVITMQHDRSPIHTSKPILQWVREQHFLHVLDWPPHVTDLNLIEHVWSEVKRVLRQNWPHPPPITQNALWDLVLGAWE